MHWDLVAEACALVMLVNSGLGPDITGSVSVSYDYSITEARSGDEA